MKKYTTDHELVVFDDATNLGTVSITNYAQSSLGDVVFVELPSKGTTVSQGGMSASRAFSFSHFFLTSGVLFAHRPNRRG